MTAAPAVLAAATGDAPVVFLEIGAVAIALSLLAGLAARLGITAIPFYLLVGLALGEGGLVPLDVSEDFISITAEIGVLLLLLTLGLEYTGDELATGLRGAAVPGFVDMAANAVPGVVMGLALGWGWTPAVLLGGVTWISSSGVVSKVLSDLDRLGNRETPAVLDLLVVEDLAMAVYLPVVGAMVARGDLGTTAATVTVAVAAVGVVLWSAIRLGGRASRLLTGANDEALLLAVFGFTLLVAGLAEQVNVSAAIGAFLVGLALSGPVQERAAGLIEPLRDLFAATFFVFFSFQIDPADLPPVLLPALLLAVVTAGGKMLSGGVAAARRGAARTGRLRAGTVLIARGEFSIVIASLGAATAVGAELGALAAAYVLTTAVGGPLAARYAERIPPLGGALARRNPIARRGSPAPER